MRKWKSWEKETQTVEYLAANGEIFVSFTTKLHAISIIFNSTKYMLS